MGIDNDESPYPATDLPIGTERSRADWQPRLALICLAAASTLTLLLACLCFVYANWLNAISWVYGYFLHGVILGANLAVFFVLLKRQEMISAKPLMAAICKMAICAVCVGTVILSWLIVGFAVLVRM